jgi:hypothetical protein
MREELDFGADIVDRICIEKWTAQDGRQQSEGRDKNMQNIMQSKSKPKYRRRDLYPEGALHHPNSTSTRGSTYTNGAIASSARVRRTVPLACRP